MAFNKKVTTLISEDIYIFLVCFKNLNNGSDCLRDIHLHSVQFMKQSLSAIQNCIQWHF